MTKEIIRKIHFFQIESVLENKSRVKLNGTLLDDILSKNQIYHKDSSYDIIIENMDELLPDKPKESRLWKISRIRKTDLPQKYSESKRKSEPLDLASDEGLYDPTHFIIFGENIIGTEVNRNGINVSSGLYEVISKHLETNHISSIKRVEIKSILKSDIHDLIDKIPEIRGISIQIATNYAKSLKSNDEHSFGKIFAAADLVEDMSLDLSFKLGRGKKTQDISSFKEVLKIIKKILSRDDAKGNIQILNVRGKRQNYDEKYENINLLEQLMICERRVTQIDERTKGVAPIDMYIQILASYETFKGDLKEYLTP